MSRDIYPSDREYNIRQRFQERMAIPVLVGQFKLEDMDEAQGVFCSLLVGRYNRPCKFKVTNLGTDIGLLFVNTDLDTGVLGQFIGYVHGWFKSREKFSAFVPGVRNLRKDHKNMSPDLKARSRGKSDTRSYLPLRGDDKPEGLYG